MKSPIAAQSSGLDFLRAVMVLSKRRADFLHLPLILVNGKALEVSLNQADALEAIHLVLPCSEIRSTLASMIRGWWKQKKGVPICWQTWAVDILSVAAMQKIVILLELSHEEEVDLGVPPSDVVATNASAA